jgi:hypothetical protein
MTLKSSAATNTKAVADQRVVRDRLAFMVLKA